MIPKVQGISTKRRQLQQQDCLFACKAWDRLPPGSWDRLLPFSDPL